MAVWALIDSNNIVQNIIVYDGVSEYTPAEGLVLQQIPDDSVIGQHVPQT